MNDQLVFYDLVDDADWAGTVRVATLPLSLKFFGGNGERVMRKFIKKAGEFLEQGRSALKRF